jgi:hypothetical protein
VGTAEGVAVLEAVMSLTLLVATPGGGVYCVLIAPVHVAIIRAAVRVARCDRRALEVVGRQVVERAMQALVLV